MPVCTHCGQEIPELSAACPYCDEPSAPRAVPVAVRQAVHSVSALSSAESRAPSDTPDGTDTPVAPDVPAREPADPVGWIGDSSKWPPEPQQHRQTGLVGGHLTVCSTSTTGSLRDGEQFEFELVDTDIVIGRSPACDVYLAEDPLVSRRHALLTCKNGGYTVVDLGSSNGTFLNGAEVRGETELSEGDAITIGHHTLLVSSAPPRVHSLPIEARLTGPVIALPSDKTDPHLQAVGTGSTTVTPSDPLPGSLASVAGGKEASVEVNVVSSAVQTSVEGRDSMAEGAAGTSLSMNAMEVGASVAPLPNLDALQMQLAELIGGLRHQAEAEAAHQQRLRQALVDVRDTLATALSTQLEPAAAAFTANVDHLAELARHTAENPRHLDYILSLSENADELVVVLEAVQQLRGNGGILSLLHDVYRCVQVALE